MRATAGATNAVSIVKAILWSIILVSLGLRGRVQAAPAQVIQSASEATFPLGLFSGASLAEAVNFLQNKCFNGIDLRNPQPLIPQGSPLRHIIFVGEEPAARFTLIVKGRSLLDVLESVALDTGARLVASEDSFIFVCGKGGESVPQGVVEVPWTPSSVRMSLEREMARQETYSGIRDLMSGEDELSPRNQAIAAAEAKCQVRIDKLRALLRELEGAPTFH